MKQPTKTDPEKRWEAERAAMKINIQEYNWRDRNSEDDRKMVKVFKQRSPRAGKYSR